MSLGNKLVTNGGFDTDSDWVKGEGWTIVDGKAVYVEVDIDLITISQAIDIVAGRTYKFSFTISDINTDIGKVIVYLGGEDNDNYYIHNGPWTTQFICGTLDAKIVIKPKDFDDGETVTVDNVSVREVLADDRGIAMDVFMDEEWNW